MRAGEIFAFALCGKALHPPANEILSSPQAPARRRKTGLDDTPVLFAAIFVAGDSGAALPNSCRGEPSRSRLAGGIIVADDPRAGGVGRHEIM